MNQGERTANKPLDDVLKRFGPEAAFSVEAAVELLGPEVRETLSRFVQQGKVRQEGDRVTPNWELHDAGDDLGE